MVIMIDITIKVLDLQNLKLKVPVTASVYELKEYIQEIYSIPVQQQEIIFRVYVLSNETKFADVDIDGKMLQLVKKISLLSTTTRTTLSNSTKSDFRRRNRDELETSHFETEFNPSSNVRNWCDIDLEVEKAFDMIRKSNELLCRIENSFGMMSENIQTELPVSPLKSDSSNMNCEAIKTLSKISTNGTLRTRTLFEPMSHTSSEQHTINSYQQIIKSDTIDDVKATNESTSKQVSEISSFTTTSKQSSRNSSRASETMPDVSYRCRLSKLLEQLDRLNTRFQPIYARYCRHIYEHYQLGIIETGIRSFESFISFNSASKVMYYISKVYMTISYLRFDLGTGNIFYYSKLGSITELPSYLSGIQQAASLSTNSRQSNTTKDRILDNSATFDNSTTETSPNGIKSISVQQPENNQYRTEYDVLQIKNQNDDTDDTDDTTSDIYSTIKPSNNLSKKLKGLTIKTSPNTERFNAHTLRTYI